MCPPDQSHSPPHATAGQNKGKAALEFYKSAAAQQAASHMNGGQLDGATLTVELSDLPIRTARSRSRSRSRSPRGPPPAMRNGARRPRGRSYTPSRSRSPPPRYRSRSRSPLPRRRGPGGPPPPRSRFPDRGYPDRGRGQGAAFGRRGPPGRDVYRPSRSRSRSPVRRPGDNRLAPRRRSPSYERGGYGRRRSPSYDSVRSSRSRTRTPSRSRTRSRSRSYSPYSRYSSSRSRSRGRSVSKDKDDDIRDSRSRSPPRDP